jgi:hypothetical protein
MALKAAEDMASAAASPWRVGRVAVLLMPVAQAAETRRGVAHQMERAVVYQVERAVVHRVEREVVHRVEREVVHRVEQAVATGPCQVVSAVRCFRRPLALRAPVSTGSQQVS